VHDPGRTGAGVMGNRRLRERKTARAESATSQHTAKWTDLIAEAGSSGLWQSRISAAQPKTLKGKKPQERRSPRPVAAESHRAASWSGPAMHGRFAVPLERKRAVANQSAE